MGLDLTYIDGFVIACPQDKKAEFIDHARAIDPLFIEYGALRVTECWEDDVPEGSVTSFSMAVKREPGEAVVFSFVEWPSKEVRDACMAKMMEDPRMDPSKSPMPFDGKRMIYGGFAPVFNMTKADKS